MHLITKISFNSATFICTHPEEAFLLNYVEERPMWPIQSPNKGRKKAKGTRRGRWDQDQVARDGYFRAALPPSEKKNVKGPCKHIM